MKKRGRYQNSSRNALTKSAKIEVMTISTLYVCRNSQNHGSQPMTEPIYLASGDDLTRSQINEASVLIANIRRAQQNHTESLLTLGEMLYLFDRDACWRFVPDPETSGYGFVSFDKWLRSDAELSYSTCRLALQTYSLLIVDAGYDREEISGIAVGKLQEIIPEIKAIFDKGGKGVYDRVDGWIADAHVLSRTDLKKKRVEVKGGKVWQGLLCYGDIPEHLRDRFDADDPIQARFMQLPE